MSSSGLNRRLAVAAGIFLLAIQLQCVHAQRPPTPQEQAIIANNEMRHFGDAPENPGPMATDLSTSTSPKDVAKAMRKVADWQLQRSQPWFDRLWTWSALYDGFIAASDSLGDPKYSDAMLAMGKKFDWKLRINLEDHVHMPDADTQSLGQAYLDLYLQKKDLV